MDEQNPRVTAEEMRGRSEERMAGYAAAERGPAGSPAEPETDRTREIRAEIAHTRGELSETVNAIQDRLRPSNLAADAAQSVKDAAWSKAREVSDSEPVIYARSNPIPAAMVGIGIIGATWLAFGGRDGDYGPSRARRSTWRRGHSYGADDYAREAESYRSARAGAAYSEPAYPTRAEEPDSRYGASASALSRPGGSGSRRWPDAGSLRRTWDDNPLVIGAAAALAGAIIGLSIPETEREHQLMGETRDSMLHNVQQTVREKVNEVQQVASDAVNTVQKIATGETGSAP